MRRLYSRICQFALLALTVGCTEQKKIELLSPDGNISFSVFSKYENGNGESPGFTVEAWNRKILLPSSIHIDAGLAGSEKGLNIVKVVKESVTNHWINNFGERKEIHDNYNQAKIFLENNRV